MTAVGTAPPGAVRIGLSRGLLELRLFFREREAVVFTFLMPVMLLSIFGAVFQGELGDTGVDYRQYFTAGMIASGMMSVTFVGLGVAIAVERDDGTLKRLYGTPMPRSSYLIGKTLLALLKTAVLFAIGYVTTAVALFTGSAWLAPTSWGAAFTLIPHCYMLLPTRWAVCAVVALNLGPGLPTLLGDDRGRDVTGLLAGTVMITTFSTVFGLWIGRIIQQSRERADLIEQLTASRAEVARLPREAGAAAERERLTGEIHDTLAQGFTSILMLLQGAEAVLEPGHQARRPIGLAARTARENLAEARALVARGRTNAEIGRELFISEATVKTHLLRAFGKLGVGDRTAAVTAAMERGVLGPPGRL